MLISTWKKWESRVETAGGQMGESSVTGGAGRCAGKRPFGVVWSFGTAGKIQLRAVKMTTQVGPSPTV